MPGASPLFLYLCAELSVKELGVALAHLAAMNATGEVSGAQWHGKAATALMIGVMTLHFLWPGIPAGVSAGLIGSCMGAMALSGALYAIQCLLDIKRQA